MMHIGCSRKSSEVSRLPNTQFYYASTFTGVRYKAAVIWDLFWTPFDERFSEILGRLKHHKQVFEAGLRNVYSAQIIQQFNAMDWEREKNSEQREMFIQQRHDAEKKAIGLLLNDFELGSPC
jgi:hypothetical protein